MDRHRHVLENKLSALKLMWKVIIIVGVVITFILGTLFPSSSIAWLCIVLLWGCLTSLIAYVFHKINAVKLKLQALSLPPEPAQVAYPAFFAEPVYPQVHGKP